MAKAKPLQSTIFETRSNLADVTFQVVPDPETNVTITGAHPHSWTRKKLIPIYQEKTINSELTDEGQRNLTSYFQSKGYFDVQVTTELNRQPNAISLVYAAKAQQLSLKQSSLRTPQTTLTLDGVIGARSNLQVELQAHALPEVETLAGIFRTVPPGEHPRPLGLHGTASFAGNLRGALQHPEVSGQFAARDFRVKGSQFRLLRGAVNASPSQVNLENVEVNPVSGGKLTCDLRAALHGWSYAPDNSLTISAHASQLSVADLAHIAGVQTVVTRTLNADLAVQGSEASPIGNGKLSLTRASVAGEPIQSLSAQFEGSGETLSATVSLRAPAGAADAKLTYYPRQRGYQFTLDAPRLLLDQVRTLRARKLKVSGQLSISASGHGTLQNPELQASASSQELQVQGEAIRDLKLDASAANHEAQFTLGSRAAGTSIRAQGKVALKDNYYAVAQLDTEDIPLQPLLAVYLPEQAAEINGHTELHISLRGPLKDRQHLEAHLDIPVFQVSYEKITLAAAAPVRADYADGAITLRPFQITGTGTDLRFEGRVPLAGGAPASLNLTGGMDLRLLQILEPDLDSHGQLQFDIRSEGDRSNPNLHGQIRIVDAGLMPANLPLGLRHANGVLTLANKRLCRAHWSGCARATHPTRRFRRLTSSTCRPSDRPPKPPAPIPRPEISGQSRCLPPASAANLPAGYKISPESRACPLTRY